MVVYVLIDRHSLNSNRFQPVGPILRMMQSKVLKYQLSAVQSN